jgi:hypothetical protein
MNLWEKLNKIRSEVEAIPKKGTNKFSNYTYVRAIDVVEHVNKLLVEHKVECIIKETEYHRSEHGKNFHSQVKSVGVFINAEKPDEREEVPFYSVAADTLDKDIYKAKTGGKKYLFTQTFNIISDDLIDPEDDHKEEQMLKNKQENKTAPSAAFTPPTAGALGAKRVGFGR